MGRERESGTLREKCRLASELVGVIARLTKVNPPGKRRILLTPKELNKARLGKVPGEIASIEPTGCASVRH